MKANILANANTVSYYGYTYFMGRVNLCYAEKNEKVI